MFKVNNKNIWLIFLSSRLLETSYENIVVTKIDL